MDAFPSPIWFRLPTLRRMALPALVIVLGLQTMRVYFPSLAWYLRDTVGIGSMTLGAIAFATFALGFVAPLVRRALGSRGALWFAGGGVAGLRLLGQLTTDPALDLYLSLAGVALLVMFLAAFVAHVRAAEGSDGPSRLTSGLVLGLSLDTLIKGAGATVDLGATPGLGAVVVVLLLVTLTLWLLAIEPAPNPAVPSETGFVQALPLVALGPFLLLQAMHLQNQGWVAQAAGIPSPSALTVILVGNVFLAAGSYLAFSRPALHRLSVAVPLGLFLYLASPRTGAVGSALPILLVAVQAGLGWSLGLTFLRGAEARRRGLGATAAAVGVGMILFLLLAFLYYVSFDLALPVPRTSVVPAAAFLVVAGLLLSAAASQRPAPIRDRTVLPAAGAVAAIGLVVTLAFSAAPAAPAPGVPGRVMTFNIHSAFNRAGALDPEAIARVIEDSGAEVVALQEVSRGWLIDGSVDLVFWLARRTGMEIVFAGTADPIWGNALMSRVGFVETGAAPLPSDDVLLGRGFVWGRVDLGWGDPALIIGTHLHHIEAEPGPRLAQIPVLLDFWGGAARTVLLGDLNAQPDWPEMDLLRQAGLVDAWSVAGEGPGYTWPADAPDVRIDWIWLSPDLPASGAETIRSTASDHLAVTADLVAR